MSTPTPEEKTQAVSDPQNEKYDPDSPHYDVTLDSSSAFYVGEVGDGAESGDDLRAVAEAVSGIFPFNAFGDGFTQTLYQSLLTGDRAGRDEGLEIRQPGEAPRTVWDNASHESMVETLASQADSAAVAETSEEWVRAGNDLTLHQKAVADAIGDSMGDWQGEAGDAAREHLASVAKWLGSTAQGAVLTGRQQQIHSQTLNETQKQMDANPPLEFSATAANRRLSAISDPTTYAMAAQQEIQTMQESDARRSQAARIMTQFDETVGGATDMPLFSPPPTLAGPGASASASAALNGAGPGIAPAQEQRMQGQGVSAAAGQGISPTADPASAAGAADQPGGGNSAGNGVFAPASPGSDGAPRSPAVPNVPAEAGEPYSPQAPGIPDAGGGSFPPGAQQVPESGGRPYSPSVAPVPEVGDGGGIGAPHVPAPADVGGAGDSTGTSSYTPPRINTPDFASPGGNTHGWSGGANGDISSRLGGSAAGAVPGGGTGGAVAGGAVPGGAVPGGGNAGVRAPASGSGAGAAAGVGGVPGPAAGGSSGAGAGGGMAPGMGGAGAGRKGEDDKEHRVAGYLEDEENIFAPEQAIAPPVIGDWENNRNEDWR